MHGIAVARADSDLGARIAALLGGGVVDVPYGDPATAAWRMAGTRTLLLVPAPKSPERVAVHKQLVEAAVRAGVRHVVHLSSLTAWVASTHTEGRDHWHTEQHVRRRGLAFTFLRRSLPVELLPRLVGADGVLRGPAGDGRISAVAIDDVAEAAAAVLRDPQRHAGRTYRITGPAAPTLAEIARLLGAEYRPESLADAYASRTGPGTSPWRRDAWISTYAAVARGEFAEVTDTVRALTGRPATPCADALAQAPAPLG